jgi:hypothetical protein
VLNFTCRSGKDALRGAQVARRWVSPGVESNGGAIEGQLLYPNLSIGQRRIPKKYQTAGDQAKLKIITPFILYTAKLHSIHSNYNRITSVFSTCRPPLFEPPEKIRILLPYLYALRRHMPEHRTLLIIKTINLFTT